MFKSTNYISDIPFQQFEVKAMIHQLEQGEVGKRRWEDSDRETEVRNYRGSTKANMPSWSKIYHCFKRNREFRTQRRESYVILEKVLTYSPLTKNQINLFNKMYGGFKEELFENMTEVEQIEDILISEQIIEDRQRSLNYR